MANTFDADNEAQAAQAFTFAGTDYKPGTVFPHKELGIHETELWGLYKAGHIRFTNRPAMASKTGKGASAQR